MAGATRKVAVERKTERMDLRLTRSAKELIDRASAFSGLSAAELAYEGARRLIEEHERMTRMTLVGADREAFIHALMNPPEPTSLLIAAIKRRQSLG